MARANDPQGPEGPGRFAYDGLDRAIHEKARLGILTCMLAHSSAISFTDLKERCSLTDGNLSRHLQVLVDAGLIDALKQGMGRKGLSVYRITDEGRRRFTEYLAVLEGVIADALAADPSRTEHANPSILNPLLPPV
jgi:DNA-binding transcriptional ArsR family regulator